MELGLCGQMKPCKHDYKNYQRIARAKFVCPKCHDDITLEVVMLKELKSTYEPVKE